METKTTIEMRVMFLTISISRSALDFANQKLMKASYIVSGSSEKSLVVGQEISF